MARRRSRSPVAGGPLSGVLGPHAARADAQQLLRERARLLRDVKKKQQQLQEVEQRAPRVANAAAASLAPILARRRALALELSALFTELLTDERLAARARKQLQRMRRWLELSGFVPPSLSSEEPDEPTPGWTAPNAQAAAGEREPRRGKVRPAPASGGRPELAGASQVGQERRSLRELFRTLARAVHPDQARHEAERDRRTEIMKRVTRAYEAGDLARLVELESTWQSAQALSETGDPESRRVELQRQNRELLTQLREVTRQLRDAKRELHDAERSAPSAELVERVSRELDDVQALGDVVRRFRDGRISLADLSQAPLPGPRERQRARG